MLDVSANQGASTRCIRLVIADRQPIVLQGLQSVFSAQQDFEIVASCSSGTSCLEAIRNLTPDVALFADTLPDLTVSEILVTTKGESLPTRLVFFAEPEGDDDLTAAISAGVCSVISKYATPDTMLRSLRLMTECINPSAERSQAPSPNGKEGDSAKIEKLLRTLTHRESQIVRLVSEGLSNKEIARQLNVSQGTVKVHLHNIFQKLEISNRTVLATIALSRRSAGFTTLSLAALAFAILSDVKASHATDTFPDDDSTGFNDLDHPAFELWKKAILRHVVVTDSGDTTVPSPRGSFKESQAADSAARVQPLHAADHGPLSNFGRGYGPIGSSTPYLFISPLLQAINDSLPGSLTEQQQFAPPATSNPIKSHGGYGTLATAAGALIFALDSSHAAMQALDPGATLIDTSAVAAMDATTQVATIAIHGASNVEPDNVDNLASGSIVRGSHPPLAEKLGHDSVSGEGNAGQTIPGGAGDDTSNGTGLVGVIDGGSGNDTIKGNGGGDTIDGGSGNDTIDGNNGNDTIVGGYGGVQLKGSKGDDIFAYRSTNDSNSSQFDTIIDFTPGEDKINLAAFGALAFLHMTSTSTSVPPHTLAWIYNSATNETIIYVNPTDGSLHIGDPGLLEIHLQGVVSVAESDFVYEPEAAAVAAALEGIDPALLFATASDGTDLTTSSAGPFIESEGSESTPGTAGVRHMAAEGGLRFHFGRDRIDSIVSSRLTSFGDGSAYATEESDGAVGVRAHVSSIAPVHSRASIPIEENLTFKKELPQTNTGAVTAGHGKAHATAGLELFEFGVQGAGIVAPVAVTELVEAGVAPGNSAGHGNAEHVSNSAAAKASEANEPTESSDTSGHSNSHHPSHSASASIVVQVEPIDTGAAPDNSAGHSYAQHAPQSASAKASAAAGPAEPDFTPGNGVRHGMAQHASNPAAAKASEANEPTESSDTPGPGNSHRPSHSASAGTVGVAEPTDTSAAPGNSAGHGYAQHASQSASAKASAAAGPAEPDFTPGNGVRHGMAQHASNPPAAKASEATEPTEPSDTPGNPHHPSHSASASTVGVAEPTDTSAAPGNSAGPPNSQHASQSGTANPAAAADLAESSIISANIVGLGNGQHVSNPAAIAKASATTEPTVSGVTPGQSNSAAAEPAEPAYGIGGAGHETAFHFNSGATPSTPTAAVELELYVLLGHEAEPAAVLEEVSAAIEEDAAIHVSNGQHHAIGHLPHDLLP